MPRKTADTTKRTPRSTSGKVAKPVSVPILDRSDFHRILADLTRDIAPGDIDTLMDAEADLRERIAQVASPELDIFRAQLNLAVDCLRDHVDGECQQIPYYTISLLGAALLYFTDELDAIPDFLPDVGKLDDAVVMAMAFELAADGLQRYCTATDRSLKGLLPNH